MKMIIAISVMVFLLVSSGGFAQNANHKTSEYQNNNSKHQQAGPNVDKPSPTQPVKISVPFAGPIISVNPTSVSQYVPVGGMAQSQLTISNNGDEDLTFSIDIEYLNPDNGLKISGKKNEIIQTPERIYTTRIIDAKRAPSLRFGQIQHTDDPYDLQFEYPCGNGTEEAGIETDGNFLYTSLWIGNQFCRYMLDGTYLETFSIPGVAGTRDLAFDGTYFYGAASNNVVFQMDFSNQMLIGTISAPVSVRAIAYDEAEDGFWANNWSTPIVLFDRSGNTLNAYQTSGDEFFYGFAWDPQGPYLWGYSQKSGTSLNMLYKMDLVTGAIIEEFDMLTILSLPVSGDVAGGLFMHPNLIEGTYTLGGLVQNVCLWGIEMGSTGTLPDVDVGVYAFISPAGGPNLGNEVVTIRVKNFGVMPQSNIPVFYTFNGEPPVTGILQEVVAPGETTDFTFPGTVYLGNPGQTYVFVGCTAMEGDGNPENDCKTLCITTPPDYCDASTTNEYEYIANVLCGDINNSSGWQGGVADYTALYTNICPGHSEEITVTNGNPIATDIVFVWVDWNQDYTFNDDDEQFILTNDGGTGDTFTGMIITPVWIPGSDYRMRIRMTSDIPPEPCGVAAYGEIEDYTIKTGSGCPDWLGADPTAGIVVPGDSICITLNFMYSWTSFFNIANLNITNNSVNTPMVTVPVTMVCQCPLSPPLNPEGYEILPNVAYLSWEAPEPQRDLQGYNVYRNNEKINDTLVSNLFYEDSLTNPRQYFYFITAVYPECEASSDTISLVITNVPEKESDGIIIFPNPAKHFVTIHSENSITQLNILNNTGQIVFEVENPSKMIRVYTSNFPKGIYFIRLKTAAGLVYKKLIIG